MVFYLLLGILIFYFINPATSSTIQLEVEKAGKYESTQTGFTRKQAVKSERHKNGHNVRITFGPKINGTYFTWQMRNTIDTGLVITTITQVHFEEPVQYLGLIMEEDYGIPEKKEGESEVPVPRRF